jgi:amino acid adenylation domain-containing protein
LRVNAPKGTLTKEMRSQIAERKAELLTFLRDQASRASLSSIPRRETKYPAPLSFAQERLWFLEQLELGNPVYNICRASRLLGKLNVAALDASVREIMRRHEVLRSAIRIVDGRPLQFPVSPPEVVVHLIDFDALTPVDRHEEMRLRIREEAARPFDLSTGPFLRCTLLRVGDDDHILILTTHHIVSDAWSMGILRRELWAFYESYATNNHSAIKDLPFQYADYAVWQRDQLQHDVLDSQLSYWKKKLEGVTVLDLPTDRRRPAQLSYRGAREALVLPGSLTKQLKELSEQLGVTLFMTLVAVCSVLLHRYTGQEDIVIGVPVANRNSPDLEGLIGFFVNTLVLRTDLSGSPTFRDFLLTVRETCLEAYAHQELPFEKLVEELHPNRELSRNPLFQVMFVLHNAPQVDPDIYGLRWRRIDVESGTAKFDLTLALVETKGRLQGSIEYSTDLFDQATIKRMAGHWQTLLKGIIADPNQPIAMLPLLTARERRQLTVTWNDTTADYPKDSCVHELFEAQVERTPDRVALEFNGAQITYKDLNRRANQLAHHLVGLGVGPEKLVAICLERSFEMVVGLLAILKAGGAYVPLDPTYPRGRNVFMLEDSKASVLLTSTKLLPKFPDYYGVSIALDDSHFVPGQEDENPNSTAKADDPAYVIYTSGSTGTPKGVIGLHRGVVNRMAWMWRTYPFGMNEKSCLKTSASFVDSVWETFGPLLQGVPALIIPEEVVTDARSLVCMLADHHVTRIVLVPSLLRAMLDEGPILEQLPQRIIWTSSGEQLPTEIVDRFRNSFPNGTLLNLYGASEVSADVTYHDCTKQAPKNPISIGRPISNTRIYLLDSQRELVPVGIPGELYLAGDGLARGYLDRPELTAAKFVVDPFSTQLDSRLYRTGDFARYLPDGTIDLLGRTDHQVKIRGYRIELGEIESTLNQHPMVKESVIVARELDSLGEAILVGYVVSTEGSVVSFGELRGFLREKLPDYMIPSFFVLLNTLPLTPNGKIDREALPPPDGKRPQVAQGFVAPRTEIEELVAQTWQEAVKVDHVGVDDNFFEIGGHSILAIQIVSRLRDAFNREVRVRALFEKPTVAALAKEIEGLIRHGSAPELPPIVPVPRNGTLPLSMNQEQMWRLNKAIPGSPFFNMPYVYQLICALNVEALEVALKGIVQRHEALRTVFGEVDGNPVQIVKEDSDFQMLVVDLRKYSVQESFERAAALILKEREQSFDIRTGPLIRAKLLKLSEVESYLLLTLHHLIGDHWSMQLLRRELIEIYESIVQERPLKLPHLRIQFGDFAAWERKLIDGGSMARQLAYWKEQLSEPLSKLEFKSSRKRRTRADSRRKTEEMEFTGALLATIKSLAIKENCTLSVVTLTAITMLLYLYTRQSDIRIGTLIANRRGSEAEAIFGHVLNTLIIRTQISPGMTCRQLLKEVRASTIEAYAHQEVPFEKLAQVLQQERNVDRASLFQVLCNYQKVQLEPPRPNGITIAPFQVARVIGAADDSITALEMIFDVREVSTMLTVHVNCSSRVLKKSGRSRIKEHLTSIFQALVLQTTTVESVRLDV